MSGDVIGLSQPDRAYPRTPEWKAMEEANAAAMQRMTAALAARNGGGYAPDASPVAGEAAEPVLSLAEAKAAHAAATAKLVLVPRRDSVRTIGWLRSKETRRGSPR